MLYIKLVKRVNIKCSHHMENFFPSNFVSIWDDEYSLNLLWSSFLDVYKSNYYTVQLYTYIMLYVNYLSIKPEEKEVKDWICIMSLVPAAGNHWILFWGYSTMCTVAQRKAILKWRVCVHLSGCHRLLLTAFPPIKKNIGV